MNNMKFLSALTILILLALRAGATTFYVNASNAAPSAPFTNWPTAAADIQSAIDAATDGDLILVTNGLYNTGGRAVNGYALTNRVAVTKSITIQSVNGPTVTVIQGYQMQSVTNGDSAIRCAYLTNGAVMIGFTLTNGATRVITSFSDNDIAGGGALCESTSAILSNCVIVANSAYGFGGGTYSGTLNNC